MNVRKWIEFYERNAGRTRPPSPDFSGECELPPGRAREFLTDSLATFQLGETGEGRKLQRFARKIARRRFPDYDRAVAMFVREENRHAGMLAAAVEYLGGERRNKQWTDSCFRWLRRLINFEFELQVLLTAEVVGLTYYALMAEALPDRQLRRLCRRLVADEVGHLRFHAEFFNSRFRRTGPWLRAAWRLQFRAVFELTRAVAWWDHRRALAAYGVGLPAFLRRSRRARRGFLADMSRGCEPPSTEGIAAGEGSF